MDNLDRLKEEMRECGKLLSEDMVEDLNPIRFEPVPKELTEDKPVETPASRLLQRMNSQRRENSTLTPEQRQRLDSPLHRTLNGNNRFLPITMETLSIMIPNILDELISQGLIGGYLPPRITASEDGELFSVSFTAYKRNFWSTDSTIITIGPARGHSRGQIHNMIISQIRSNLND